MRLRFILKEVMMICTLSTSPSHRVAALISGSTSTHASTFVLFLNTATGGAFPLFRRVTSIDRKLLLEAVQNPKQAPRFPLVNQPSHSEVSSEVSSQDFGTAVSKSDIPFVNETSFCEVPLQPGVAMLPGTAAPSVSELHKRITEELEKCSSLLYCCHDVQTLVEARSLLQATFRPGMAHTDVSRITQPQFVSRVAHDCFFGVENNINVNSETHKW
ncbi:hypothetical protein HPB51_015548 [Rhipicephalus microplus]|uniref:Uncharacterized protein n=1 Tax=Rhipicephalus microplus TaxID=6941 RepID=A0A9J6EI52_RHIMP|nr:hypothetical protein HPB51_015548 [Rhipicephalus microplus]